MWSKLPILLSLILYLFIFYLRSIQGGWDLKLELFKSQRQFLDQKISQLLPSPQAELLSGILLGQNKDLPSELKLALRDTSTLHIVVASGQNLSMIGGLFLTFSSFIRRRNAILISLLAITLYALLTGFQLPILRAAIMFALASLGQLFGRQSDGFRILIITVLLMLLINPGWLFQLSFQLSVMATFGVIVVAPILLKLLGKLPLIGQDLAVTLAAQVMVTPIIAQNFHQFSYVSLITNVLILWTIPFIMIFGSIVLFLGIIWQTLATFFVLIVNALLTYFIYIVYFFSSLPFSWQYIGEKIWIVWVGYYFLLAAVVLLLNNDKESNFC